MNFFSEIGRRVPTTGMRIFSESPQRYYKIEPQPIDFSKVLENSIKFGGVDPSVNADDFQLACEKLKKKFLSNPEFKNLFKGVHIPFICKKIESLDDLGKDLQDVELPNFHKSFNARYPEHHFKAILQSNSQLAGSVSLDSRSRYDEFVAQCQAETVVGWYFPQALQEFDVESQRKQMSDLPNIGNICLSGGVDIMAALIGSPHLLIGENDYAPILCMSAYVHSDPRLVLLIKSYGPHMEFWCMTQMLTRTTTQVSEQWSGGITIYDKV